MEFEKVREEDVLKLLEERKFADVRDLLKDMEPIDIAELLEEMPRRSCRFCSVSCRRKWRRIRSSRWIRICRST